MLAYSYLEQANQSGAQHVNSQAEIHDPLSVVHQDLVDPSLTIIRTKDVEMLTGLKRSTISKYVAEDPGFPRPVPLTDGTHRGAPRGFVLSEVRAWIASRIAARDARKVNQAATNSRRS